MEVREVHPEKQLLLKEVRVEGRVMEVREVHPEKQPPPREVTPSGTV